MVVELRIGKSSISVESRRESLYKEYSMRAQTERYKAQAFEPRNLVIFFLIALGLNWLRAALVFFGILKGSSGVADPSVLFAALAGWSPTIAAFLLTAFTEGKPGVSALWTRFWNRNLSLKWLTVTLLFVPAIWLLANLVTRLIGGWNNRLFDRPDLFFAQFAIALIACLGEEFGWRGYVLPRFQVKWNALVSSLILGVIWAAWHNRFYTGLILNPIFAGAFPQPDIWEFVVWIVTFSVFFTWIFNNTHGSILMAVLFHTMMNAGSFIFWCCTYNWHWSAVLVAVAILIVFLFGPKDLVRQRTEEGTG